MFAAASEVESTFEFEHIAIRGQTQCKRTFQEESQVSLYGDPRNTAQLSRSYVPLNQLAAEIAQVSVPNPGLPFGSIALSKLRRGSRSVSIFHSLLTDQ